MDSLPCACRCRSVGTADAGTAPGSVKDVLACAAKAIIARTTYSREKTVGIPPVLARKVMVNAEYPIKNHTMMDIMVPAGSSRFSQTPCSSEVPMLQDQDMSLKSS